MFYVGFRGGGFFGIGVSMMGSACRRLLGGSGGRCRARGGCFLCCGGSCRSRGRSGFFGGGSGECTVFVHCETVTCVQVPSGKFMVMLIVIPIV